MRIVFSFPQAEVGVKNRCGMFQPHLFCIKVLVIEALILHLSCQDTVAPPASVAILSAAP